ncbi:MAG TPA: hypothetical protein VGF75_05400 [Candidatus Saccharimonadales bacterium]|jgi:hypothetical protein
MTKEAIDFSVLEDPISYTPTLEEILIEHKEEIAIQVAESLEIVDQIDRGETPPHTWLVSFADHTNLDDFVSRYSAMVNVFRSFGVLDAYYRPDLHPTLATMTGTMPSWGLKLRRPDGIGTFRVVYAANSKATQLSEAKPIARQTIYYERGMH